VREQIQADAGRPHIAKQMRMFVRELSADSRTSVWGCSVTTPRRIFAVFLDEDADRVLGVIAAPKRPDGSVADAP
jgi:hypothetical protein